jgi:hypothetical protein
MADRYTERGKKEQEQGTKVRGHASPSTETAQPCHPHVASTEVRAE